MTAPQIEKRALDSALGGPPHANAELVEQPSEEGLSAGYDILEGFTPRQTEVATLMAQAIPYAEIARELGVSEGAVKYHASRIFALLGVVDRTQLIAKLSHEKLDDNILKLDEMGIDRLTPRESQIFEYIGRGLSYDEITRFMFIESTTLKFHVGNVNKKLGFQTRDQALPVAQAFSVKRDAAATIFQRQVVEAIRRLKGYEDRKRIRLAEPNVTHLNNPDTLRSLYEQGYISGRRKRYGNVDMIGLVAALLMNKASAAHIMKDPHTKDIAQTVVKNEVRVYLSSLN